MLFRLGPTKAKGVGKCHRTFLLYLVLLPSLLFSPVLTYNAIQSQNSQVLLLLQRGVCIRRSTLPLNRNAGLAIHIMNHFSYQPACCSSVALVNLNVAASFSTGGFGESFICSRLLCSMCTLMMHSPPRK